MSNNRSFRQDPTLINERQQGRDFGRTQKIKISRLLKMDLFSFCNLVEAAEEPMDEDEDTTDLLEEGDADMDNDGAEIDDEAVQSSELDNDRSFDGIGQEDSQVQLQINSYWVLHAFEVNGQGRCRFHQPAWTRNCRADYKFISDLVYRLNGIARWLDKHAGRFLLNPDRVNWHNDMADALKPINMNQKGFVEAINAYATDNLTKHKKMGEDYFSRIADKLLIVWPGKTAVKIKDLIESMKDDGRKKPISDHGSDSTPVQSNDNPVVLPGETVIPPKQEPMNKNEERAIQYLLISKVDQEKWLNLNLPLKKFIANKLGNDGRKNTKILKEIVEKLINDEFHSPLEIFLITAIQSDIKASELEQLYQHLVQSINNKFSK